MKHVIELDWRKVAGENCSQEEGWDFLSLIQREDVTGVSLREDEMPFAIFSRKKFVHREA